MNVGNSYRGLCLNAKRPSMTLVALSTLIVSIVVAAAIMENVQSNIPILPKLW
jgi:hypothetical protein